MPIVTLIYVNNSAVHCGYLTLQWVVDHLCRLATLTGNLFELNSRYVFQSFCDHVLICQKVKPTPPHNGLQGRCHQVLQFLCSFSLRSNLCISSSVRAIYKYVYHQMCGSHVRHIRTTGAQIDRKSMYNYVQCKQIWLTSTPNPRSSSKATISCHIRTSLNITTT